MSVQTGLGYACHQFAEDRVAGKLAHFAYALTHIFQITRWNRTLRLVN